MTFQGLLSDNFKKNLSINCQLTSVCSKLVCLSLPFPVAGRPFPPNFAMTSQARMAKEMKTVDKTRPSIACLKQGKLEKF
jgi:hypothetical protein